MVSTERETETERDGLLPWPAGKLAHGHEADEYGYLYVRFLWLTDAVRTGLCCCTGAMLRVGLGT